MERPGERKFPHLFQPGRIGKFDTGNRVKYAACSMDSFGTRDGFITDRELARMADVARTGCAIITNQGAFIDPGPAKYISRQIGISDDKYIPGLKKVAELIHEQGAIAIQQILHCGRYGGYEIGYCLQPSAVRQTLPRFKPPREMTKDDIKACIKEHADGARRAIEAGYDGVELCGIMGYLITNFNSKFTNRRSDEYGGSIENRGRFMREVIAAIRDTIGDEHVLSIRLNGAELMDEVGGNTPEDCLEFIRMAAQAGVDCVSIGVGWQESRVSSIARDVPDGYWLYLAEQAKKSIDVPTAFGARLGDPVLADKAIAEGKIDFWEVCRPFLADPKLLHKVAEDRLEDIKPCIGCLFCLSRFFNDVPYGCTVNPILGHELECPIQPAARRKRIMVVGAGPAGLECALTAAQRGHEVTIYEKSDRLGGQVIAMSEEVSGQELFKLLDYYQIQLKKLGVEVRLNTEVTRALVRGIRLDVDAIVLATGSAVDAQRYGGKNIVVTAHDVLEGRVAVGRRVIVCGGGKVGLVTAEYLARMGKEVCIVEEGRRIAADVISTWRWRHMAWVEQFDIKTLVDTKVKEVADGGLIVVDTGGAESFIPADTIVAAAPRKPRQELAEALEFLCDELYVIGDAAAPRWIHNAIHDGFHLGVSI